MSTTDIISYIASILSTAQFLPQAILIIRTKDTTSLSVWMWLLSFTATIFWTIFSWQISNMGMLLADLIILVLSGIILFYKTRNIYKGVDKL
jgi:MtN3 and saliva related transmembrane protein